MTPSPLCNGLAMEGRLRHGSAILEGLVARDELLVLGAEYALETGAVEFLAAEPSAAARP